MNGFSGKILLAAALILLAGPLFAQTNAPLKLALVAQTDEAAPAVDLLTAQLSGDSRFQLLERDEIDKVYREQGLSTANCSDLQLGRVLGADGLLLLNVVKTSSSTNLMVRLIAVKPGVILTDGSFSWPLKDGVTWAQSTATYLDSFSPKLSVQAKDAIPLSIVNLRSALQSADELETERDLKLLAIQRLSQEPSIFVLEREKMQLLDEEKNLKGDDSAFWDGSYLLDGVVDQNGYSKDTLTIDVRLNPPKGGAPVLFEVSGSRTNLAEVINALATNVTRLLNIRSTVTEWNATDEAGQYLKEASWALKWGVFPEAEAAADSAWALGKQDLDCALVQVQAYTSDVSAHIEKYQTLDWTFAPTYDANEHPVGPAPSESEVQAEIARMKVKHPQMMLYHEYYSGYAKIVDFAYADVPPDPGNVDRSIHALELYYSFSRTSTDGLPKVLVREPGSNDWHDSAWYQLGIEDLVAASQVLRDFCLSPKSQSGVADKLADLRGLARSVSSLISQSPSVHDSYFVGDRAASRDELDPTMVENPNFFRCEVNWGCFWQDQPQDAISLYRELMGSPVFCYIHRDFWVRDWMQPRLVSWNEEERGQIPVAWTNFLQELQSSTNVFLNSEAAALAAADADNDNELATAVTNLFNGILENRDAFVSNNVEVMYLDWDIDSLVESRTQSGVTSDAKDSLSRLFYSDYYPKFEAMDQEYSQKTLPALQTASAVQKQKEYLAAFTPYDFMTFVKVFSSRNYSKAEAAELLPFVVAYESNLLAEATSPEKTFDAKDNAQWVDLFVGKAVRKALAPAPAPQPQARVQQPRPSPPPAAKAAPPPVPVVSEIVTNVLVVNQSFTIPLDSLVPPGESFRVQDNSQVTITAHHWFEGKLVLDLDYDLYGDVAEKGAPMGLYKESGSAIALLDPANGHWDMIPYPPADIMTQNSFYHRTVLLHGNLFNCDGGQIREYDFDVRQWQTLKISDGNNYELFAVSERLFAANKDSILEIVDNGNSTRILASTRRQPPVSTLDSQDLGTPTLFEGSGGAIRVSTGAGIFELAGNDWHSLSGVPSASFPPEIFADGILYRHTAEGSEPMSLSFLAHDTNQAELYLQQKMPHPGIMTYNRPETSQSEKTAWSMPTNLFLAALPAAIHGNDLYLLVDHSQEQDVRGQPPFQGIIGKKFLARDGYHAELLRFTHNLPLSEKVFLRFDSPDAGQPLTGSSDKAGAWLPFMPSTWMLFSGNSLFFGVENPRNVARMGSTLRTDIGGKASVWVVSYPQIEAACVSGAQAQLADIAQEKAAEKKAHDELLAKYDRNHNGMIDPDERAAGLGDPAFIEFELDKIDANHDGWLEANELTYFDINHDGILDPKAQAAIDIAQHVLAVHLMNKFDAGGKGFLSPDEFADLQQYIVGRWMARPLGFPGANPNGQTPLSQVEDFLKSLTRAELRLPGSTSVIFNEMQNANTPPSQQLRFKLELEYYWKNSGNQPH